MSDYFISREQAADDLLAAAAFIGERIKSSDGHAESMQAVVPRYLAAGNVDLAAELANAVDDPYSRDKLLTDVAVTCAELDDDEYALQLADAIEDHGLRAQAFERIGLVKADQGKFEKAAEIAGSLIHPDFVLAAIAIGQEAGGDAAAADATMDSIEFASARVSALHQIAAAKIEAADADRAVDTLNRAVAAATDIEHDEERIRAICDVGNQFLEAGRNDLAIETFEHARLLAEGLDNIHRDFFLVNCALGFLYAGSGELAERTLDLITDKTQMGSALLGFARHYWNSDHKDDALEAIDEAEAIVNSQTDSDTRDMRARNGVLAALAAQFAGFGKTDRGVEAALKNPDPAEQMAALAQIAQILTVQREDELARQTINLIAEDSQRVLALIGISDGKSKLGETATALEMLGEAAGLAETIPQLSARSTVLNEITARLVEHKQTDRARSISLENLSVIASIRDGASRAQALTSLSSIYTRANFDLLDDEKAMLDGILRQA